MGVRGLTDSHPAAPSPFCFKAKPQTLPFINKTLSFGSPAFSIIMFLKIKLQSSLFLEPKAFKTFSQGKGIGCPSRHLQLASLVSLLPRGLLSSVRTSIWFSAGGVTSNLVSCSQLQFCACSRLDSVGSSSICRKEGRLLPSVYQNYRDLINSRHLRCTSHQ